MGPRPPLKITKLPSQHYVPGHHRPASETRFKWRFTSRPILARFIYWIKFVLGIRVRTISPLSKFMTKQSVKTLDLDSLATLSGSAHIAATKFAISVFSLERRLHVQYKHIDIFMFVSKNETRTRSRWGAIANSDAKVFDLPPPPQSTPSPISVA